MRVLVTAASKHGATAEIAAVIGETLTTHDVEVDVRTPETVTDLTGFDAVVLGSGVYAGHWLAPATELVDRLGPELAKRPVWLFSSGPIGDPPKPAGDPIDVADIERTTSSREHRVFSGKLDKHDLNLAERAITAIVHSQKGDFRDWDAVAAWAETIAKDLKP